MAKQRAFERERLDRSKRRETNLTLMNEYTQKLTEIADQSNLLPMIEIAALQLKAHISRQVNYYLYYGLGASSLQQTEEVAREGQLRATYLSLKVTWEVPQIINEAEIRVHMNGLITFHNSLIPIFLFVWRHNPELLQRMLSSALEHPHQHPVPASTHS